MGKSFHYTSKPGQEPKKYFYEHPFLYLETEILVRENELLLVYLQKIILVRVPMKLSFYRIKSKVHLPILLEKNQEINLFGKKTISILKEMI